jgi:GDP-mannose 6-dehydrogenase
MEVFCQDTKLNLSPYYLKPGFAFGGSCLPKDLRALTHKARELDVEAPMLGAILTSNRQQVERAVELVLRTGRKNVGVLGLSFKSGTDDLRESPMVTLIEALLGKGLKLAIYDREVELAKLFGANKEYIEREIPHISSLMRATSAEVVAHAEVLIIGKRDEDFRTAVQAAESHCSIVDLVRLWDAKTIGKESNLQQDRRGSGTYEGLCW